MEFKDERNRFEDFLEFAKESLQFEKSAESFFGDEDDGASEKVTAVQRKALSSFAQKRMRHIHENREKHRQQRRAVRREMADHERFKQSTQAPCHETGRFYEEGGLSVREGQGFGTKKRFAYEAAHIYK